jgi:hypothetical protein
MTQVNELLATLTPEERELLANQLTTPKPTPSQEIAQTLTLRVPEQHERGFAGYMQDMAELSEAATGENGVGMIRGIMGMIETYATNPDKAAVKEQLRAMSLPELQAVIAQLNRGMTAPK